MIADRMMPPPEASKNLWRTPHNLVREYCAVSSASSHFFTMRDVLAKRITPPLLSNERIFQTQDNKVISVKYGVTQSASAKTLREWLQGRRMAAGGTRAELWDRVCVWVEARRAAVVVRANVIAPCVMKDAAKAPRIARKYLKQVSYCFELRARSCSPVLCTSMFKLVHSCKFPTYQCRSG
jgi:hypothetical protein